jgi:periplasmic protein CpxP/Spy
MASVFMLSVTLTAQEQITPEKKGEKREFRQGDRPQVSPEKRAKKMATDLGLTATEKANIQALFEKQDVAIEKFKSEVNKESDDFRPKFRELRKSQDAELKSVIGEEKYQKLQTIRAEQRQKMQENGNAPKN